MAARENKKYYYNTYRCYVGIVWNIGVYYGGGIIS